MAGSGNDGPDSGRAMTSYMVEQRTMHWRVASGTMLTTVKTGTDVVYGVAA